MKIAIMTFYKDDNYGTALQAAALRQFLISSGHRADIISYLPDGKVSAIPENYARSEFMQHVKKELREAGNPPLFTEPQYSDVAAYAISAETGAPIYTLDPLVNGAYEKDAYETGMQRNAEALLEAFAQ